VPYTKLRKRIFCKNNYFTGGSSELLKTQAEIEEQKIESIRINHKLWCELADEAFVIDEEEKNARLAFEKWYCRLRSDEYSLTLLDIYFDNFWHFLPDEKKEEWKSSQNRPQCAREWMLIVRSSERERE
jgi:hypothetical protein